MTGEQKSLFENTQDSEGAVSLLLGFLFWCFKSVASCILFVWIWHSGASTIPPRHSNDF